jgi:2-C-methyl-D-erythritol 4-phosphate cytidylyltransferase
MRKTAIIVAGGAGIRMGTATPKQFLPLMGRPVLFHTLQAFFLAYDDLDVVLVLPAEHLESGRSLVATWFPERPVRITTGGATRFHSVQNGLKLVTEDSILFVHDGVRCLVSPALIRRCYEQALHQGSAIPVVASRDSIRLLGPDGHASFDRDRVMLVQTPQTFQGRLLVPAYQVAYQEGFTDEATVAESFGHTVSLTEGEEENIKITRPADLLMAAQLLEQRAKHS